MPTVVIDPKNLTNWSLLQKTSKNPNPTHCKLKKWISTFAKGLKGATGWLLMRSPIFSSLRKDLWGSIGCLRSLASIIVECLWLISVGVTSQQSLKVEVVVNSSWWLVVVSCSYMTMAFSWIRIAIIRFCSRLPWIMRGSFGGTNRSTFPSQTTLHDTEIQWPVWLITLFETTSTQNPDIGNQLVK